MRGSRIVTISIPTKIVDILDDFMRLGLFPSRSELIRTALWKFLMEHQSLINKIIQVEDYTFRALNDHLRGASQPEFDMRVNKTEQQLINDLDIFLEKLEKKREEKMHGRY